MLTLGVEMLLYSLCLCVCLCMCLCTHTHEHVHMEARSHFRCMQSSHLCETGSLTLQVGDYARLSEQLVPGLYLLSSCQIWDHKHVTLCPSQVLMLIKHRCYQLTYLFCSVIRVFAPISILFLFSAILYWTISSVWLLIKFSHLRVRPNI